MLGVTSLLFRHNAPFDLGRPCLALAAASTGNSLPSITLPFPFLSPASTSHQFLRVFFPCRAHFAVTSSINSATSVYLFSTSHWRMLLLYLFADGSPLV